MVARVRFQLVLALALALVAFAASPARAQDRLCDPGNEDCRALLISYIRAETAAIDVAFWFMEDARYANELVAKARAGVPVRVLIDPRANSSYPLNAQRLAELQAGGIPMRRRLTNYILHWKMMLFHGQNIVEFSGANYSADAWRPATGVAYENYVDEMIYFTSDTSIVNSFRTRFDDQWVDTTDWANYANISGPLNRQYGIFPQDPSLNFAPWENFRTRSVNAYNAERRKIDVIMYRITDRAHADGMLAAVSRGIPVRLITEPEQYRDESRMWHAWNVDRLYMGGVQIKHRAHLGLNHQKSVILYDQNAAAGDQSMVIFGSSNWTSPSAAGQVEHNIFTSKPYVASWAVGQFERKWNNLGGIVENLDFVPLPPDAPKNPAPASGATGVSTAVRLTWYGGPWAHLYDVYLDTSPDPITPMAINLAETPSKTASSTFTYTLPITLRSGTTYYWKVVGKTMAMQVKSSQVWSFTTAGPAPACAGHIGDFDGDCRVDFTVFRPSTSTWYQRYSRTATTGALQFGTVGDIPAPADFDGDARQDIAVFRPSDGVWYIRESSTATLRTIQWGQSGDVPQPADYDGDGQADAAVYRPGNGTWYVRYSTGGQSVVQWGIASDRPLPADYDLDGRTDVAVYRPSTGVWYLRYSSTGATAAFQWGSSGDMPVPGDYDGDRRTDFAVFRPSTGGWFIRFSGNGSTFGGIWGGANDRPVAADYDGDGKTDLAVYRPSNGGWYVRCSSTGTTVAVQWGFGDDVPIPQR
jgi:hypothetical protein